MKSRFTFAIVLIASFLVSTAFAADDAEMHGKSKSKKQGWLGVNIQDVTPRFARDHDLKVKEGAFVEEVVENSPADSAGVKEGDVITEYNGKKIEIAEDVRMEVGKTVPGTKVNVIVNRNGDKKTIAVVIGKNKMRGPMAMRMPHRMMNAPRHIQKFIFRGFGDVEGMDLMELNKQLGEYFGAPNGEGVLVKEVEKESNAAKAGIKAGDVLIKIDKETIEDVEDIHDALDDLDEGAKATVELLRNGKKTTVSLEISEKNDEDSWNWDEGCNFPGRDFDFEIGPDMRMLQRDIQMNLKKIPDIRKEIKRIKIHAPEAEV